MVIFSTFICEKPGAGYEQKEDQVGPDDYSTSEQLVVKFSDKMVKNLKMQLLLQDHAVALDP